jgi:hypothetical protein
MESEDREPRPITAYERAMMRFRKEQQRYELEQELFRKQDDDQQAWKELMVRNGRLLRSQLYS